MGLGFLNISNIIPDRRPITNKYGSVRERHPLREYYIELLDLPQYMNAADQRQVMMFVNDLLNGKPLVRVQPGEKVNLSIAEHIVSSIIKQQ